MTYHFLSLKWLVVAAAAALLTYVLLGLVIRTLRKHIAAKVTPRSSHLAETPEGAGIVVVPVTIMTTVVAASIMSIAPPHGMSYAILIGGSALILTVMGFVDDARGLPVLFRLLVQCVLVSAVVFLLPENARVLPAFIPIAVERVLIVLGGVWFVNLYNFMDGIDLISVVETASITIGILILAALGTIPQFYGWLAAALLGAVLGFAPWNVPPARLFLGDAGSIAIGFLLGVILLHTAAYAGQAFAPAVIMPLYYLADATLTLVRRCWRGEQFWRAHREHFYQQAMRNGFSVGEIIRRIAGVNIVLVALAVASTYTSRLGAIILFAVAVLIVGSTLRAFSYGRRSCMAPLSRKRPSEDDQSVSRSL